MNIPVKVCGHGVAIDTKCGDCDTLAAERLVKAKALTDQVLEAISNYPEQQQSYILECGMRMRELACYYGPYFKLAMMLTSCEISSGDLLMSKTAPCEEPTGLMLPGMKTKDQLREIILPGNDTRH